MKNYLLKNEEEHEYNKKRTISETLEPDINRKFKMQIFYSYSGLLLGFFSLSVCINFRN